MPNSVIFTSQPATTLAVVPNQNTTFNVAVSSNFNVSSYTYQWKKNNVHVAEATTASYSFEPALADDGKVYRCMVSGLSSTSSGETVTASVTSTGCTLSVAADAGIYFKWTLPAAFNPTNESGEERFHRMRNLGY